MAAPEILGAELAPLPSTLEEWWARKRTRGAWTCRACALKIIGCPEPEDGLCSRASCKKERKHRAEIERRERMPKSAALADRGFDPRVLGVTDVSRFEFKLSDRVKRRGLPLDIGGKCNALAWTGDPSLVVIAGPNGTGKTHLADEMAYAGFRAGLDPWCVTATELVAMAKRRKDDQLARIEGVGLLVLDEIGVGHGHDAGAWVDLILASLLDRHRRQRPTILTTHRHLSKNPKGVSFQELLPAMWDRAQQGLRIVLAGESKRRAE